MISPDVPPFHCVLDAWQLYEAELRRWLLGQLDDAAQADDILQEIFVKALREGGHFCQLDSPRAWLYQVARHAVIDYHRLTKATVPAEETLAQHVDAGRPVDALANVLGEGLDALGVPGCCVSRDAEPPPPVTTVVDVTAALDDKGRAVAAYRSQAHLQIATMQPTTGEVFREMFHRAIPSWSALEAEAVRLLA